ncbi:phosphomannomutase/phosphoglucomutase [Marinobacter salinexigens]|uniref:phosphomannomutase n=1 Tax=Marinobacter salinexigens TaxID=2919747 RepID=A0A5B0VN39_9GAMM|nr:phosphomannomutase/phosphoglucomutase [Marinobacter salinexigens]KAA1175605.1 phosphomannomutase/phosphoglucomutase [Marinobacter salinexigens]
MKLGKKKSSDSDAPVEDKHAKKAAKAEKKKATQGPKHRKLGPVAFSQAAVVVLAGILAAVLIQFLVVQPSAEKRQQLEATAEVESAALRLNQYLALLQSSVNGLASRVDVINAVTGTSGIADVEARLGAALPGVREVHIFPYRDVPGAANGDGLLGFTGLELARKAELARPMLPDAFPKDNKWYFQMASPVRNPASNAVLGSVLVIFDTAPLKPLLQVVNGGLGGQLALMQTVSGGSRVVVSSGNGSQAEVARPLVNPDWSVVYRPAKAASAPVDIVMIGLLTALPALIAAIVCWVLLSGAQKGLRQDLAALVQWSHKAFGGERSKMPDYRWDMVASAGEVFFRLAQSVEKRVAKATETEKPKSGGQAGTPSDEEPLFQESDVLDIDMLDGDEDLLGFGSDDIPAVQQAEQSQVELSPEIFRAYDIRGIVGDTLSADVVRVIGQAIGSEAIQRGVEAICIGYDGRHSSPELADALANGIMATGCNVIPVGAVPTPVLYFATHELGTGSGVMVTGSHNPANYNGLKIMLGGETLSGDAIQKLYQRTVTGDFAQGQGSQNPQDIRRAYLDRIIGDIAVAAPLKVVVDAGNGIAGELAPILVEELGCEVVPLYCDVDGDFPNHHPDPGKPANLADLIARVKGEGADIGLAFDGDGDRLGVVTNTGKIIWPDRLLMLFARDVVSRNPGSDVLYDVKCSRRLAGVISEAGGRPIMWKTGHSLMKAKMKETGALLAGEMSGHIFFGERWFGFDDGLYSAARLLEILGIEDRHSEDVFEDFPEDLSTPELNVEVTEENKFAIIDRLGDVGDFGDGSISTIDGIRVDYSDGWGLCRASNTTPVLVLRFEAENEEALERIKGVFREQLKKAAPDVIAEF